MSGLWFNFSAKGGKLVSEDGGKTWRAVTDEDIERVMTLESHPRQNNEPTPGHEYEDFD